jgi:hypothetical protein
LHLEPPQSPFKIRIFPIWSRRASHRNMTFSTTMQSIRFNSGCCSLGNVSYLFFIFYKCHFSKSGKNRRMWRNSHFTIFYKTMPGTPQSLTGYFSDSPMSAPYK